MTEPIISILAILLILYLGKAGAAYGLFFELISTVLLLFALLVTLRYWYVATQIVQSLTLISGSYAAYAAFVAYWVLFLLGCAPLLVVMKMVNEDSLPKYPNSLDNSLGFVFGMSSAAIFICVLMTSLSVIMPKVWEQYDNGALLIPLDKAPIAGFQYIERNWYGITTNNPAYTRFPTFKKADADSFEKYWR